MYCLVTMDPQNILFGDEGPYKYCLMTRNPKVLFGDDGVSKYCFVTRDAQNTVW